MITRLIAFVINTGLVTSVCALASLITVCFISLVLIISLHLFAVCLRSLPFLTPLCTLLSTSRLAGSIPTRSLLRESGLSSLLLMVPQSSFPFFGLVLTLVPVSVPPHTTRIYLSLHALVVLRVVITPAPYSNRRLLLQGELERMVEGLDITRPR